MLSFLTLTCVDFVFVFFVVRFAFSLLLFFVPLSPEFPLLVRTRLVRFAVPPHSFRVARPFLGAVGVPRFTGLGANLAGSLSSVAIVLDFGLRSLLGIRDSEGFRHDGALCVGLTFPRCVVSLSPAWLIRART